MITVIFNIPKERCKEVEIKGIHCIQVDTGLTPEELISILVNHSELLAAVTKEGAKNEADN